MLTTIGVVGLIILAPFLLIVFFGAPYVPTFRSEIKEALKRVNVNSKTKVVDLGAGDGRLLILAAENGAKAIGYELNPWMWLISWLRTRKYSQRTTVYLKDYRRADLHDCDVVFVFTSELHKKHLKQKLEKELAEGSYLLSNGFRFDSFDKVGEVGSIIIYRQQ